MIWNKILKIKITRNLALQDKRKDGVLIKYHDRKEGYITIPKPSGLENIYLTFGFFV